jgi:transcriptional regulator with XRE-family HTH domain
MQSCHDVVVATPDLQRLAERVKARRLELNLSIKRAATLASMSKDTWTRVETGANVHHVTYDKVETALRWTVGSCRKIMDGGDAILLDAGQDSADSIQQVPSEDLEEQIRQAVQGAMVAGTDLNASKIREVNERAIAVLRARGILPPAKD